MCIYICVYVKTDTILFKYRSKVIHLVIYKYDFPYFKIHFKTDFNNSVTEYAQDINLYIYGLVCLPLQS